MTARTAQPAFTCPKCGGAMRSYERSGIVLEQCPDCRGIFLDHGELERFVDAEGGGWSGRVGAARPEWRPDTGVEPDADGATGTADRDERARQEAELRREAARSALRDLLGENT